VLDNIHEDFKGILGKHDIKVHSFQEAKGISGMKGLDSKVHHPFPDQGRIKGLLETFQTRGTD
jgi:hypothetical protein